MRFRNDERAKYVPIPGWDDEYRDNLEDCVSIPPGSAKFIRVQHVQDSYEGLRPRLVQHGTLELDFVGHAPVEVGITFERKGADPWTD
jgi:hypothetical protein